MRLIGASMVRNEADIVEVFVRHNLTVLDRLVVIDHGSTDGTTEILQSLVQEGLPLTVQADDSIAFRQSEMMTRLVREVFGSTDADFVFAIDADEFLKVPSRPRLERALASLPPGAHALLKWHTYAPDFAAGQDTISLIRSARRLSRDRHGLQKAVVARHFLNDGLLLDEGNHRILRPPGAPPGPPIRQAVLIPEEAAIAHVPIRTAAQFSTKVAIGWLACLSLPGRGPGQFFHWGEAYAELTSGRPLTPRMLTAMAANYSVLKGSRVPPALVSWVDDPFLGDLQIAYGDKARHEPLALVLQFAERMALSHARASQAG
jgi:Glycosyl transferase family 2